MYLDPHANHRHKLAFLLAILTIGYNLLEGLVSVWFGLADESLMLFGFGLDSFIEMISGMGILAMVLRLWRHPGAPRCPVRAGLHVHVGSVAGLEPDLRAKAVSGLWTAWGPGAGLFILYRGPRGLCQSQRRGGQLPCEPLET